MVDTIVEYIERVERTVDHRDTVNNIYLLELYLSWLLFQHGNFKQVMNDYTTNQWRALQNLLESGKEFFSIYDPVVGSFFDRYAATGRFLLDRSIGGSSHHNYFLIFVDELDASICWPLAIHELAHCWLSSQNSVIEISSQIETNLKPEDQENRIEEAMCDAIASRVMGSSYAFSYINRLWTGFARKKGEGYPLDSFRVEIMIRTLRNDNHIELQQLESLIDDLECDDWNDEEIVESLDLIEEFAIRLPFHTPILDTEITNLDEFRYDPPDDIRALFHVGWDLLNLSDTDTYSEQLIAINRTIQETLERNSATFNT